MEQLPARPIAPLMAASVGASTRWLATALLLASTGALAADATVPGYADLAPTLAKHCTVCHSGAAAPLGLRLDSYEGVLQGSQRGPIVRRGDPASSELTRRLRGTSLPRMPMSGPPYLAAPEIDRFESWILAGMPRGAVAGNLASAPAPRPTPAPGQTVDYRHVAPIFATRCAKCHTTNGLIGGAPEGYRLTDYSATIASEDRARVVPGHPEASELVRRIRGDALPRMPFDGPPYLTAEEIHLIERWVADGARNGEGQPSELPVGAALRLHGRLGDDWRLDRLPLVVDRQTRIDKSPRPGDYVEVRGQLDVNGNVRVQRLRRR